MVQLAQGMNTINNKTFRIFVISFVVFLMVLCGACSNVQIALEEEQAELYTKNRGENPDETRKFLAANMMK